jgi:hypothetical protein
MMPFGIMKVKLAGGGETCLKRREFSPSLNRDTFGQAFSTGSNLKG